jgi:endoglucanase
MLALLLTAGCESTSNPEKGPGANTYAPLPPSTPPPAPAAKPVAMAAPAATPMAATAPATPAATAPTAAPGTVLPPVRINAGLTTPLKDADGNTWLPDQGFADGETTERPDVAIANTKTPDIYRSEHYSMTSFTYPVPNGNYVVKLHFCETFEGITGPGERVFSFNVQGQEFKDFDVWVKAGGFLRAYVQPVNVHVTDGKVTITFKQQVENPQINGIEILPAT